MLRFSSRDQAKGRSDGGKQGRASGTAGRSGRVTAVRRDAPPPPPLQFIFSPSHRAAGGAGTAAQAGERQYWLVPVDHGQRE